LRAVKRHKGCKNSKEALCTLGPRDRAKKFSLLLLEKQTPMGLGEKSRAMSEQRQTSPFIRSLSRKNSIRHSSKTSSALRTIHTQPSIASTQSARYDLLQLLQ